MAIDKIFNNSSIDDLADNVLSEVDDFMLSVEKMQKRKVAGNVQLVIQALKKIDNDIREKYDGVTTVIEKRVSTIKDGKDGQNGANGRDGKDGRPGRDGAVGPRGVDGLNGSNGRDGDDGVSVTNAFIDFDGSLVINLSDGQSLNVGEVVAPDLAEKIKVITNGGGTSQGVLDTLTSLQNQINLISSALVYKGTWNASTNTPALASGVGTANSFYIVSVAGTTTLDGISNWGVGDWATFNGTAWQRVEGGAAGNFTTLTTSGAATIQGLTVGRGGSAVEGNTVAGANSLGLNTTGLYNTSVGFNALFLNADGNNNTGVGANSGVNNVSGDQNTSVGYFSLYNNASGNDNTAIGYAAGAVAVGSGNVMLGNRAGAYETGSNSFYVDNQNRTNTAGDKAGALLYGTFSATPASQTLKVNAALTATYDVTLSAGTANGVTYLNGSKVLTSGNELTFDGSQLGVGTASGTSDGLKLNAGNAGANYVLYRAGATGLLTIYGNQSGFNGLTVTGVDGDLATLTSTGLGIGTSSPTLKLDVNGSAKFAGSYVSFNDNGYIRTDAANILRFQPGSGGYQFRNAGNSDNLAVLDVSGNLGLGVTPSAWSGIKAFENVGGWFGADSGGTTIYTGQNNYNNGTNYLYKNTAAATLYTQALGQHRFFNAPSGTAGDAITFTQAMTLDAGGNLLLGNTSTIDAAFRLQVTGAGGSISTATGTNSNGLRFDNTNTTSEWSFGTNSPGIQNAGDYFAWNRLPSGGSWSEFMRLDASGNLGLGVTPSAWNVNYRFLQLSDATGPFFGGSSYSLQAGANAFINSSNTWVYGGDTYKASRYTQFNGEHLWFRSTSTPTTGADLVFSQAMTLDESGNLQLATTTSSTRTITVGGTNASISLAGSNSGIYFGAEGTPVGSGGFGVNAVIARSGGTSFHISGSVAGDLCIAPEGTKSILFGTSASANSVTERARITSGGDLLVGTTTQIGSEKFGVVSGSSAAAKFKGGSDANVTVDMWNPATSGDNIFAAFRTETAETTRGTITYNRAGGLVAYNVTSDYRAKDIIGPVTESGALIDATPVYMGKMKGATQERPMFIAHEVPAYAHTGEKDAVDADGNPVYQQMDASALIPVMWAEIQNLRQRLAAAGI